MIVEARRRSSLQSFCYNVHSNTYNLMCKFSRDNNSQVRWKQRSAINLCMLETKGGVQILLNSYCFLVWNYWTFLIFGGGKAASFALFTYAEKINFLTKLLIVMHSYTLTKLFLTSIIFDLPTLYQKLFFTCVSSMCTLRKLFIRNENSLTMNFHRMRTK